MRIPFLVLLCAIGALLCAGSGLMAQTGPRTEIFSTRRVSAGRLQGDGHWVASVTDELVRDLNRDGDQDDMLLCMTDLRQIRTLDTLLALDPAAVDADEDWPVAVDGDTIAVIVSEYDSGNQDLNRNGVKGDNILAIFNPSTQKVTFTPHPASNPRVAGTKVYFLQSEEDVKRDLNGDQDARDTVVCVYDVATDRYESLGMEAGLGFLLKGDTLVTRTSEVSQGMKDLNADGDVADLIAQVYSISQRAWTNSGLDCSFDLSLSTHLLAVGVTEQRQGSRDLNVDGDTTDVVCFVRDLATGQTTSTQRDCSGGVSASGRTVGFICNEASQGKADLNGNNRVTDEVAFCYRLGAQGPVNIGWDASGGLVTGAEKVVFACSEESQKRDLNRDRDTEDLVLAIYDPVRHVVSNLNTAVEGPMVTEGNTLVTRVPEIEQGDRDLNRDNDADDSVLLVVDLATNAATVTGYAATENLHVTSGGFGFAMLEADQGDRDINGDGDSDDEIIMVGRVRSR